MISLLSNVELVLVWPAGGAAAVDVWQRDTGGGGGLQADLLATATNGQVRSLEIIEVETTTRY